MHQVNCSKGALAQHFFLDQDPPIPRLDFWFEGSRGFITKVIGEIVTRIITTKFIRKRVTHIVAG